MNSYATTAATTLIEGGPGTGKTRQLVERLVAIVEGGVDPHDVIVFAASAPAAEALAGRIAAAGDRAASVRVTTPMAFALEGLAASGARAFTGGRDHLLAAFEENFFLEDMRVIGQKQRRLREMLKFLERGWSEMRDDEEGWLITGEERAINEFAREDLRAMGSLHPAEVTAAYVYYLASDADALAAAQRPYVFMDDYRAMSRASQRLARLVAQDGLVVTWSTVGGLRGEEPYGYVDGLAELADGAPTLERVMLAESRLAAAPQRTVANLCAQECMASVEAPALLEGAEPGGFEVLVAPDLNDEMPLLAERVAALVGEGVCAPDEVYIAVPSDAWARRACSALAQAGIPASRIEGRQALGGDIRDLTKSAAAAVYTALHLAADPTSAVAWRCWCGFGDYLGCSASMTALAHVVAETGTTLPELLAALDRGELVCEAVDCGKALNRYRAGKAVVADAAGLKGTELLRFLAERVLGAPEVPAPLLGLLGEVDGSEDAATLYARVEKSLFSPVFGAATVRVGGFDAALGQCPRVLVCCGMANGLVPTNDYFELTMATIEAQEKMHARLMERLAALAGKAREAIVCTTFERAGIVEAETLKLKTERVRLREGRRVCDLAPSVCVDYMTGAKLAYVR